MKIVGLPILVSDRLPLDQLVLGGVCPDCRGWGTAHAESCSTCNGTGVVGVLLTDIPLVEVP